MSLIINKDGKLQAKRAAAPLRPRKDFTIEVKDFDAAKRTVMGYAAIFGNVDAARDMIIKGAFAKSIQERGPGTNSGNQIIFLWMHDMDEPIGRVTKLTEDEKGLYFEAIIDNIEQGDRAVAQLQSGTLKQFSIGFNYVWDKMEYDYDLDAFVCKEIYLAEISVVSLSCNEDAMLVGMKSSDIQDRKTKYLDQLDDILKTISSPKAYKVRAIIDNLTALAAVEPVDTTKQKMRAASTAENAPGLNWGALSNALNT